MQRNTSGKNQGTLARALENISKASIDITPFLFTGRFSSGTVFPSGKVF